MNHPLQTSLANLKRLLNDGTKEEKEQARARLLGRSKRQPAPPDDTPECVTPKTELPTFSPEKEH